MQKGPRGGAVNIFSLAALLRPLSTRWGHPLRALQAGTLLARRLFGAGTAAAESFMDYANVPTAVFTPLE